MRELIHSMCLMCTIMYCEKRGCWGVRCGTKPLKNVRTDFKTVCGICFLHYEYAPLTGKALNLNRSPLSPVPLPPTKPYTVNENIIGAAKMRKNL